MIRNLALILALMPSLGLAETLVATRTIPSQTVIAPGDLGLIAETVPGALREAKDAIGLEARVALYVGRPIRAGDLGPPALIERNTTVQLLYRKGGLEITAEGRALDRAAIGETVRVMNAGSRNTVIGRVREDGTVVVTQ